MLEGNSTVELVAKKFLAAIPIAVVSLIEKPTFEKRTSCPDPAVEFCPQGRHSDQLDQQRGEEVI